MKLIGILIVLLSLLVGCETKSPVSVVPNAVPISLSKQNLGHEFEVKQSFRVKTERPGEWLTVFVFHAKGGNGKGKPRSTKE